MIGYVQKALSAPLTEVQIVESICHGPHANGHPWKTTSCSSTTPSPAGAKLPEQCLVSPFYEPG